jgi:hypothetical protein
MEWRGKWRVEGSGGSNCFPILRFPSKNIPSTPSTLSTLSIFILFFLRKKKELSIKWS